MPSRLNEYPVGTTTPDRAAVHPEVVHLGDEPRQGRLGGRGGEDQQVLAGEVPHQPEDRDVGHGLEQTAEDAEHEDEAGEVERDHQGEQLRHRGPAGLADDARDRTEGTDRGQPQDHREDLEDQALQARDAAQDRLTGRAQHLDREADEERDEERLEHVAARQRGEQGRRDDALEELGEAAGLLRGVGQLGRRVGGGRREVEAAAGVDEVADDEPDREGDRRHDEEVDEGEAADPADRGGLPDRADAEDDRAEDDRGDHHLDQADEHRAENADALGGGGGDEAQDHAGHHRHDDGDVEPVGPVALLTGGRWCGGGRAGER